MKKRKTKPNMALRGLLATWKNQTKVTSKQIADVLGVSPQTVSSMSGHLDEMRLSDLGKLSLLLGMSPEVVIRSILMRSQYKSSFNPNGEA